METRKIKPNIRFADKLEYTVSRGFTKTYACRMFYIISGNGTLNLRKGINPEFEDYIKIWIEADAGYKFEVFVKSIVSGKVWKLDQKHGLIQNQLH